MDFSPFMITPMAFIEYVPVYLILLLTLVIYGRLVRRDRLEKARVKAEKARIKESKKVLKQFRKTFKEQRRLESSEPRGNVCGYKVDEGEGDT